MLPGYGFAAQRSGVPGANLGPRDLGEHSCYETNRGKRDSPGSGHGENRLVWLGFVQGYLVVSRASVISMRSTSEGASGSESWWWKLSFNLVECEKPKKC